MGAARGAAEVADRIAREAVALLAREKRGMLTEEIAEEIEAMTAAVDRALISSVRANQVQMCHVERGGRKTNQYRITGIVPEFSPLRPDRKTPVHMVREPKDTPQSDERPAGRTGRDCNDPVAAPVADLTTGTAGPAVGDVKDTTPKKGKPETATHHRKPETPAPVVEAETGPGETVFAEAERIIYGDREQVYGHPAKNLSCIADFWRAYLTSRFGAAVELGAEDVAAMMALLKIAREANMHKRDNLVDACGYLGLIERVLE